MAEPALMSQRWRTSFRCKGQSHSTILGRICWTQFEQRARLWPSHHRDSAMTHIKPTATPAWQALTVHYDKIKTLLRCSRRTPAVANGLWRKGLDFISLLKEPHHRG